MEQFNPDNLKKLYKPAASSHKGQNGKLLIIGGSHLFHAASLWALEISSKVVDMVFYASVPENNQIVHEAKELFHNGIVVEREDIEDYIEEADAVLIGPGMVRSESEVESHQVTRLQLPSQSDGGQVKSSSMEEINKIEDEGIQTYYLTKYLLQKYPHKRWIIDAGALQMLEPEWLKQLGGNAIITPHPKELERVFGEMSAEEVAKEYNCVVLLKGEKDILCSRENCNEISGGNAGMTKGGTGDVLAGLVAALACKNDLFLAATAGSYINKKAGEALFERVSYYFNASDLVREIPVVMRKLLL